MISRTAIVALTATVMTYATGGVARAEWLPNGTPLAKPVAFGTNPSVVADGDGGAFALWRVFQIVAQHITGAGDAFPGWPRLGANNGIPNGISWLPVAAADSEGGFYVVWLLAGEGCSNSCAYDPATLWVTRRTAAGARAPGWPSAGIRVETSLIQARQFDEPPVVIADGDHGVLIAWRRQTYDRTRTSISIQSIDPGGERRWGDDGVLVFETPDTCSPPALVADGKGGAFLFWRAPSSPGAAAWTKAQHVSASGMAEWAHEGVPVSTPDALVLERPVACSDGANGAIVAWAGGRNEAADVLASRVNRGGGLPWRAVTISGAPGVQSDVQLIAQHGGAIVAWRDARREGSVGLVAQRLTHDGRLDWAPDGVSACSADGVRGPFVLVDDGEGGAFLAWGDSRAEGDLYATRLTEDGARGEGWPADGAIVSRRVAGNSEILGLDAAAVGRGRAILAWQDVRFPYPGATVATDLCFAMLLTPDGPAVVPPAPEIAKAAGSSAADVRSVASSTLTIRAITPNPVTRDAVVRFSLPTAAPATLELIDLAGRRMMTRDVGGAAGEHDVVLARDTRLAPGIYLVRLTQAARTVTARVAVIR